MDSALAARPCKGFKLAAAFPPHKKEASSSQEALDIEVEKLLYAQQQESDGAARSDFATSSTDCYPGAE